MGNPAHTHEGTPTMSTIIEQHIAAHDKAATGTSVALVTGGGRGIGRIVASALADAGVAVGLIARSAAELDATVDAIEARGGTVDAAVADVTHPDELTAAITAMRRS